MRDKIMVRTWWLRLVILALLLNACASPIEARSAHYNIGLSLELVGLGKRPITLTLHDKQGLPVTGATVTLLPIMRQHGMLAPPVTFVEQSAGVYVVSEVNLDMSGEWQMQVTVVLDAVTDMVEIPVMVE
jgi:hypothetical protein